MVDPTVLPFEEVYEKYARKIHAFCVLMLGDPAAAEDVTADTFLAAFKVYDKVQPHFRVVNVWLMRIARNAAIDQLRRRKRWEKVKTFLGREQASPDAEHLAILNEEIREAVVLMEKLTTQQRQLIAMHCGADLSYGEISQVLGLSTDAARASTHRAVARLRAARQSDTANLEVQHA